MGVHRALEVSGGPFNRAAHLLLLLMENMKIIGMIRRITIWLKIFFLYYMALGRVWYGAKYSHGVWERFAHQFEKLKKSEKIQMTADGSR